MHCPQLILGFFGIQQLGAQKLLLWQLLGRIPGNPSKVQGRVETCGNYMKLLEDIEISSNHRFPRFPRSKPYKLTNFGGPERHAHSWNMSESNEPGRLKKDEG